MLPFSLFVATPVVPPSNVFAWTPAYLAVQPLAWIDAPSAVWSGSALTSYPGFALNGSPSKGAAQNGVDPIRVDANSEFLTKTIAVTSGALYYFWIGKALSTSGVNGIFNRFWGAAATGAVVAYLGTDIGGIGSAFFGNGYNPGNPYLNTTSDVIGDTNWHSLGGALSASVASLWKDGVLQTTSASGTAALPSYSSSTWEFFRGGASTGTEGINSDTGALLLLDYIPATDERQRTEGYYHHLFGAQSLLDAGHPYKAAPPTTGPATVQIVGATSLSFSARENQPDAFQMGVNIAMGSFSYGDRNAVYGSGYVYPTSGEMDYWNSKNIKLIRLPFMWERMQPTLGTALNSAEVNRVIAVLNMASARGMHVIPEPHDYGRYDNYVIGDVSANPANTVANFADFWARMAVAFGGHAGLWSFGLINEPHDMGNQPWATSAQAAINAIRATGNADRIFVPGDGWSAADIWATNNPAFPLTDSANKLTYEAHQYFDANHTGGYTAGGYDAEGAYPNVGVDRIQPFIDWLAAHNQKGFIGEFNVPGSGNDSDPRWLTVLNNVMTLLHNNNVSGTAWSAGPWWGSYSQSLEPAGGVDKPQVAILNQYN